MNTTMSAESETLKVPGASLYYEVRGSGPVLLMMPGGPADAGAFNAIVGELDRAFTVLTYDPRGLSHSKLDEPLEDARIVQTFADDVHRLLKAVTSEPAFVFGSSGGAVIGLELVARHPDQVRTLVAHEPPAQALLPAHARHPEQLDEIEDTYRSAGVWPAMQKFMQSAGIKGGPPPAPQGEPTPEMVEGMAQMERNFSLFLGHYLKPVGLYQPDFAALKASPVRIVPGVGQDSSGELAHEGGLGLATALGTDVVVFPGAHGGFDSHAVPFAVKLREVLAAKVSAAKGRR
jgi:pimeloyl-ACP methyl ester carboxylesterase